MPQVVPAAPARPEPSPGAEGPVAPGTKWPEPAPLPPEEDERPWWKLAIPVAAIVAIIAVGIVFVLGRSSGDDADSVATKPGTGSVDISDLDDPTDTTSPPSTTTTASDETTTTAAAETERVPQSQGDLAWTMQSEPATAAIPEANVPPPATGRSWTAADGLTTETVEVYQLGGEPLDLDAAMARTASTYGATLTDVRESHIAEAPGRTGSFTGTLNGKPVVGWTVGAQLNDQAVVATTVRLRGNLEELYPDFLALPSSFDFG